MATIAVQSTPSSPNYIPPEITDQIIDYLHHDVKDLASCSTVAKTWLPVSRYHLFRQVHLHGANVAQLISLLDSPHSTIGPHIHVVKVAWNRKVLEYSRFQRIVTLPAVSMLHFYNVAWVDISEETRPFPLDGLPGITVLRMTDTRVTPSEFIYLLRAFPSLQAVQMEDFRWVNDGHIFPSENTVNLRKLHIGGLYKVDMLDWLMSSPDVWRLDSFKVGFNGGISEMPKVLEFMQMQKPYLKDFVVSFSVPSMIPKFDSMQNHLHGDLSNQLISLFVSFRIVLRNLPPQRFPPTSFHRTTSRYRHSILPRRIPHTRHVQSSVLHTIHCHPLVGLT